MALDPFTLEDEEEARAQLMAGGEPELDLAEEEDYEQTGLERFLEGLSGLRGQAPTTFGEGLLSGFSGGLGAAGGRIKAEREKFEKGAEKRAAERNTANLKATAEYRAELAKSRGKLMGEKAERERRLAEKAAESRVPTPADVAANPALKRFSEQGIAIPVSTIIKEEIEAPERKATVARAEAAAVRTAGAQERAASAAERQTRLASASTLNQLQDQYTKDPDIATYRGASQNFDTMSAAAKQKSGVGDLALLISYVRATEPGVLSVVRQEELSNVTGAVSAIDRIAPHLNLKRFLRGDRLSDPARKTIVAAGKAIVDSRRPAYERANAQFKQSADYLGVPTNLFMREYGTPEVGSAQSRISPTITDRPVSGGWFERESP